jgi:hypothetical protein
LFAINHIGPRRGLPTPVGLDTPPYLTRHGVGSHPVFNGGFRVLVTGLHGFERTVTFAIDDDPAVIAERVRETLEE